MKCRICGGELTEEKRAITVVECNCLVCPGCGDVHVPRSEADKIREYFSDVIENTYRIDYK